MSCIWFFNVQISILWSKNRFEVIWRSYGGRWRSNRGQNLQFLKMQYGCSIHVFYVQISFLQSKNQFEVIWRLYGDRWRSNRGQKLNAIQMSYTWFFNACISFLHSNNRFEVIWRSFGGHMEAAGAQIGAQTKVLKNAIWMT